MQKIHTCPLCEALCGILVDVEDGVATKVRGDPDDPLSRGHICPKAAALPDLSADPDRIREPMRRQGGQWVPVSWDSALAEAAERIHAVQQAHGRNALGVYLGNPNVHHYDAVLAIQATSGVFRTRNRFSATSVDQLPHMFAAWAMFGHQLLFTVPDIDRTQHLIIMGANPAASNGSIMTAPGVMKRLAAIQARGGKVVVIDPRRTRTAKAADQYVALRPGTDALLLLGMLAVLFDEDLVDPGAWQQHSDGLDALRTLARQWSPARVSQATGVPAQDIATLARELAAAPSAALYCRIGSCTQRFGGLSTWLALVLTTLTGNLDRAGGLMLPTPAADLADLGTRTGAVGHYAAWHSREQGLPEFGGELPVSSLSSEIETPGDRQIRTMLTVAGNPVLSTPDGPRLERALAGLDFMVSLDIYINETTRHAHLILPAPPPLSRDHYGLIFHALAVRNTARYSQAPAPEDEQTRTEWDSMLGLGAGLLRHRGGPKNLAKAVGLDGLRKIGSRRALDLALRFGPHGLSTKKLLASPHGIDFGPLTPGLHHRMPNERYQLAPEQMLQDVERLAQALDDGSLVPDQQLLLIGRRDLRSNNSWMHNSQRLVKGKPRCTLLVHPADATALGLTDGGSAKVSSAVGQLVAPVSVDDTVMRGVVSLPHGWGHGGQGVRLSVANKHAGVNVNALTDPAVVDELTGNATLNGVPVTVVAV